tara:strand:+ start:6117 stop:6875 length:759 start_codon:yes stop_codon:yes gene_type:complete
MAQQNIFDELAPYAALTVVPGVTVGQLNYVSHSDLYASGVIPCTAAKIASDSKIKLFDKAIGETGAGWSGPLTEAQTNVKFSGGRIGANQCYVATHVSVAISQVNSTDPNGTLVHNLLPTADALWAVATNFSWNLTTGRGITRNIGPLLQWPAASGVYGITGESAANLGRVAPAAGTIAPSYAAQNGAPDCAARKLSEPIVFAPLVNTSIEVSCGNNFQLSLAGTSVSYPIQILMTLKGFLFTMPVGNVGGR